MNCWLARVVIAGVLNSLIGCSPAADYGSWAPPPTGPEAECERNGGVRRAALNFCEHNRAAVPGAIVAVPQVSTLKSSRTATATMAIVRKTGVARHVKSDV